MLSNDRHSLIYHIMVYYLGLLLGVYDHDKKPEWIKNCLAT
jgi:hypothetical protein